MNKDRKHIRLPNHDYSSDGEYFITICCSNRECFFGKIENDEMILNEIGIVANKYLQEIPVHFHNRIVIHSHHNLAWTFKLKGIHLGMKSG